MKQKKSPFNNLFLSLITVFLMGLIFVGPIEAGMMDSEKEDIGKEITTLYRASRGVIAKNQALINDASKGNKGLTADVVISATKANYKKATGKNFTPEDASSLKGQAQSALLDAITEVVNNAQPLINEKGKGLKGFLPAIFAKQMGDAFNKRMVNKSSIKLTAPKNYVRNRANRPDKWENHVIENIFKKPNYEKNKVYVEQASHKGKPAFRLLLPEYYKQACLNCHGGPKGAKDITGGKKEGGKLGELGGAISFVIYD
ncbi:MAG: DUF3365 domain-containing protein [Nitrospinales bacterium]